MKKLGYAALVMVRVHHKTHPQDLVEDKWRRGPVPLQALVDTPVISNYVGRSWIHDGKESGWAFRLKGSCAKHGYYGWFKRLVEPETHAGSRGTTSNDDDLTILHLPTSEGDESVRRTFVEIVPMSASASLGATAADEYRDSFLFLWVFGSGTAGDSIDSLQRLTSVWKGMDEGRRVRTENGKEAKLLDELLDVCRDSLGPFSAVEQRPYVLATVLADMDVQHRELLSQRYPLGQRVFGGYPRSWDHLESAGLTWSYDESVVLAEPIVSSFTGELAAKSAPQGLESIVSPARPDPETFVKDLLLDTSVAFRVASIQSLQLGKFVERMQSVRVDDGVESKDLFDLQRKYYVFKRRHHWSRIARRSTANELMQALQRDWDIESLVTGLDTEVRDYTNRATLEDQRREQQRRDEEQQRRDEEDKRRDEEENRRRRWGSLAKVGSLALAATALISAWATVAAVPVPDGQQARWLSYTSPVIVLGVTTAAVAAGAVWSMYSERNCGVRLSQIVAVLLPLLIGPMLVVANWRCGDPTPALVVIAVWLASIGVSLWQLALAIRDAIQFDEIRHTAETR